MSVNDVRNRGAKCYVKSDEINIKSETDEDKKIKKEEPLHGDISEASTLDLEDVSEGEKSHSPPKRKREIIPLLVSNLPESYNLIQITDYLVKLCGPCEVSFIKNGDSRAVEAIFASTSERANAKKILSSQSINEFKIRVDSPILRGYDSEMESETEEPQTKRRKETEEPWGLDMDVWRPDPRGWFGAKPKYLASLGIEGSLQNWVMVRNFRCGNDELREVMSLAGDVLVCSVSYNAPKRFARVMYRHPLEALQAVSMLNNQIYYGSPLSVKIIKASGAILPRGLNNIGPGLAKYGGPLRDVLRHYERFVKGQENDLNTIFFRTPQEQSTNDNNSISSVTEENKRIARKALETLIALVGQGVKINDLVEELKSIKAEQKDSIDQIIKELDASDSQSNNKNNKNNEKDDKAKDESRSTQPSPISSDSSGHNSRSPTPDGKKSKEPPRISQQITTVSLNRLTESGTRPSPNIQTIGSNRPKIQPQPVAPGTIPSYCGIQRHMGPGPSGPPGPMPGSVRPQGPVFTVSGPRPGPIAGPMPGPRPGTLTGPMSGPMSRPMSVPVPGPMSGPMSGPISGLMSGPISGPMCGPISVSGPAGPMMGSMITPNFAMPGPNTQPPFGPNIQPTGNEALLQFSNLPLSTTFALLSDKLSQVGQLVSIQFTTPGCVLVTFAHRSFAERCRQQFDQSRLEGNLIDVRFV